MTSSGETAEQDLDQISPQALAGLLDWMIGMGADEAVEELPVDAYARIRSRREEMRQRAPQHPGGFAASHGGDTARPAGSGRDAPGMVAGAFGAGGAGGAVHAGSSDWSAPKAVSAPDPEAVALSARDLAARAQSLEELKEAMISFEGCSLRKTAMNTVFSDGNPDAHVMFVGEAPGADEDRQGLPFVGVSGQLLDRMIGCIGLSRSGSGASGAYIANILPWRPPGNRAPSAMEIEICRHFIERHIQLVNPRVLVFLGGVSAKTLLRSRDGIMRLRGKWKEWTFPAPEGQESTISPDSPIPAIATFHPAYLLRQPAQKRETWRDLLSVADRLKNL